jgi:hypothetical protein
VDRKQGEQIPMSRGCRQIFGAVPFLEMACAPHPQAEFVQAEHRNITDNWYADDGGQMKAEEILLATHKGINCFDWQYYKMKNPDVASLPQKDMWNHFLKRGAVEFREHRWKCKLDAEQVLAGHTGVVHV